MAMIIGHNICHFILLLHATPTIPCYRSYDPKKLTDGTRSVHATYAFLNGVSAFGGACAEEDTPRVALVINLACNQNGKPVCCHSHT